MSDTNKTPLLAKGNPIFNIELGALKNANSNAAADQQVISKIQINTALKEKFDSNMREHNQNLNSKFTGWVRLEAISLFFSMAALVTAIFDYELVLSEGGMAGLAQVSSEGTDADWALVIQDRLNVAGSNRLRILVAIFSVLAIVFLALRNINQVAWKNDYFNKQLQRETLQKVETEFVTMDMKYSKFSDIVREVQGTPRLPVDDPIVTSRQHAIVTKQMDEAFVSDILPVFNSGFWAEVVILAIFPWPYFDKIVFMRQFATAGVDYVAYFVGDLLLIIMFFRIYACVRHMERYHEFTDIYSKKICQSYYGFVPSRLFSIKIEMIQNPSRVAAILFLSSTLILAQILRIFELPWEMNDQIKSVDLKDYGSAIWLIVITSTTVGYGDIYPHTVGGQFVIILTAFWGTFLVSLLVLVVANVFDLSSNEQKAIAFIKQSRSAATSISRAFQFYLKKKAFYLEKLEKDPKFNVENSTFLTSMREKAQDKKFGAADQSLGSQMVAVSENRSREPSSVTKMAEAFKITYGNKYTEVLFASLGLEMNKSYRQLEDSLAQFSEDKQEYISLLPEHEVEMLNSSRVVKKEVIDMSDMMDRMSLIMLQQNQAIQDQATEMKTIRKFLTKDEAAEEEKAESVKEEHEDDLIPALFSIRRSPYYQTKICQRQLVHPILGTKRNLKQKMADESDFYGFNRKAEAEQKLLDDNEMEM